MHLMATKEHGTFILMAIFLPNGKLISYNNELYNNVNYPFITSNYINNLKHNPQLFYSISHTGAYTTTYTLPFDLTKIDSFFFGGYTPTNYSNVYVDIIIGGVIIVSQYNIAPQYQRAMGIKIFNSEYIIRYISAEDSMLVYRLDGDAYKITNNTISVTVSNSGYNGHYDTYNLYFYFA